MKHIHFASCYGCGSMFLLIPHHKNKEAIHCTELILETPGYRFNDEILRAKNEEKKRKAVA